MHLLAVDHPLVAHKLTLLRDARTNSPAFRQLTDELVTLLSYEATRDTPVVDVEVESPVASTKGVTLTAPKALVVPILRAGLGMLDGLVRLLPSAEIGFLGMVRDEQTLEPAVYAERLPADLTGRRCYILDPMLATGGTLAMAVDFLVARGVDQITAICLLAAPEGLALIDRRTAMSRAQITIVTAAVDERLNEKGYIVPGLGDAGDRLYGVVD